MSQITHTFTQSSAKLIVTGFPDYSNNDSESIISIITEWKLLIVNKPEIQGNIDHLKAIVKAFYEYSYSQLFNNSEPLFSNLIDIKTETNGHHNIVLKSTKQNVKPLSLNLGNAEYSDIINCFDQLNSSKNINIKMDFTEKNLIKNNNFKSISKLNLVNKFVPPIVALLSVLISYLFTTYVYKLNQPTEEKVSFSINNKSSEFRTRVIRLY